MTIEKIKNFLKSARRGNRLVYHIGNLQHDRQDENRKDRAVVDAVGKIAYQAYLARRAHLVQKRVEANACTYILVVA